MSVQQFAASLPASASLTDPNYQAWVCGRRLLVVNVACGVTNHAWFEDHVLHGALGLRFPLIAWLMWPFDAASPQSPRPMAALGARGLIGALQHWRETKDARTPEWLAAMSGLAMSTGAMACLEPLLVDIPPAFVEVLCDGLGVIVAAALMRRR